MLCLVARLRRSPVPVCLAARLRDASLPEVLCPSSGLCRASSTRCFPSLRACSVSSSPALLPVFVRHLSFGHIQGSFALFAPLHQHLPGLFHPGATHGVLPSEVCSYPEPDTFRLALSCFSLATKATSRSLALRLAGLSTSPSPVLACRCPTRSCERPLHRTALLAVSLRVSGSVPGFPVLGLFTASLALEPRFHVPEFQESSPGHARFLGALFKRLPSSHLSWLFRPPGVDSVDLGLDFASLSPPVLASAARALAGTSGSRSVLTAAGGGVLGRSSASFPIYLALLGFLPSYLDLLLEKWPPAGSCFHLRARSTLPSRHPLVFAESPLPTRAFLPERIRPRLSGHW